MIRKISSLLFVSLLGVLNSSGQSHRQSSPMTEYVQQASEFSSRARANVYFHNQQSIFNGVQVHFVNVGTGNLTFLRRDLVVTARIPIVVARVYDSNTRGSSEFGQGWKLSATETIELENGRAHLFTESGSEIVFIESSRGMFRLERDQPSDYSTLYMTKSVWSFLVGRTAELFLCKMMKAVK